MNILLIEDDEEKARKVSEFLEGDFPGSSVQIARSFSSGLRALIAGAEALDVVLLDMSMPNYDVSPEEPTGGTPEHFAGSELLAQMRLRSIHIPTIVLTMFDSFGEAPNGISLQKLVANLSAKYSPTFKGFVYYNSAQEGWRASLKKLIKQNARSMS